MLGEIAAQRLDTLALDPGYRNAAVGEPARDRKPAHAGGLHDGQGAVTGTDARERLRDEGRERACVVTEADRPADRPAVIVDLGNMIATDGEVDADGSVGHREDPCL